MTRSSLNKIAIRSFPISARCTITSKNWEFEMNLSSAHLNMPKIMSYLDCEETLVLCETHAAVEWFDKIFPHIRKMYDYFDELGVRNGSFIRPPQHAKARELWRIAKTSEKPSCSPLNRRLPGSQTALVGRMEVYTAMLATNLLLF